MRVDSHRAVTVLSLAPPRQPDLLLCHWYAYPDGGSVDRSTRSQESHGVYGDDCLRADSAITNAKIYTVTDHVSKARHVAMKNGTIIALSESSLNLCEETQIIDGTGLFVYPGFSDSHLYLKYLVTMKKELSLQGIDSLKATMGKVAQYALANPQASWITGGGCIETRGIPLAPKV